MKTSPAKRHRAGYVALMLVIVTGSILSVIMIYAYKRALNAQDIQANVQLRVDYSEKEEAILRSIVVSKSLREISVEPACTLLATTIVFV